MRRVATVLVLCWASSVLGDARFTETEREQLRLADTLDREGRYDEAIAALKEIPEREETLYALGQLERKKGDCAAATDYYVRFLRVSRSATARSVAQLQLDRCKQERPAPPAAQPATSPPSLTAATVTAAPPRRRPRAFIAGVVVGVAAGIGLAVGLGVGLGVGHGYPHTPLGTIDFR